MVQRVSRHQVGVARAVVRWYLDRYRGTVDDLGGPATFTQRARVGCFSASPAAFERGEPRALFRIFIAMTLFQRRQDQQVFRILRGMKGADVRQVSEVRMLNSARLRGGCRMLRTSGALHEQCDLSKLPGAPLGTCGVAPNTKCYLKRHTVLLKRYGHFGKVPTSAALMLSESGVRDLRDLHARALAHSGDPQARARFLEAALMRVWRVNRKIAAMFLSALCNPDLGPPRAPWREGVDWTPFVVIDSNTDLFLASVGYTGPGTYDARLEFIRELSRRIDLSRLDRGLHAFNPRIVQQALYTFMSRSNRRNASVDCSRRSGACSRCPALLASRCPVASVGPPRDPGARRSVRSRPTALQRG